MYLVFTRMPGESYPRRLGSLLLCLCDVFRALINSLVCQVDSAESSVEADGLAPLTLNFFSLNLSL